MNTKQKRFIRVGIIIVLILLLGFTILSIPAIRAANRAAHRMLCTSYLYRLCFSVHEYQFRDKAPMKYEKLPFYGDKTSGEEYWSWRAIWILYNDPDGKTRFRFSEPWNSQYNLSLFNETQEEASHFFCPCDLQKEKSSYVAVKGPGTLWTEMQDGNLPGDFWDYGDMILIIETTEPKNFWAEPGDDITPEEVIRLFEADPGLVKNSQQKWWNLSHWPKNFVRADGLAENFGTIKEVEELRKLLIVSPEQIEAVRKKVEETSADTL